MIASVPALESTADIALDSDDFALFGLPRRHALDLDVVEQRRRDLQSQVHPDRHAAAGNAAQRLAMQWSVRVNEARQRLSDPLRRAAYLCELAGVPIDAETNTAMPTDVLMQQLEWREALDAASSRGEIDALAGVVAAQRAAWLTELSACIDERHDFVSAAQHVRRLMFVDRHLQTIERRLDAIEADEVTPSA